MLARLWPRSIVQPPLTEADLAVLAAQALQNQRRDDQHVEVSFDDPVAAVTESGTTPRIADETADPVVSSAPEDPGRRQEPMARELR